MIREGNRNSVAIRVPRFLEQSNPKDTVPQKEGALLKKYHPGKDIELVWTSRYRRTNAFLSPSALKILEEAYLPKGCPCSHMSVASSLNSLRLLHRGDTF
ncbi:hypothetical protein FA13DRAFT_1738680 [Coprinellus micaceus]|jgi:hypothetical protein|uniref:Uncharacterized protein n=1 Tax=Coprinellus micaceus TaxID=71717 RepID=A0A4Y7STS4_COPMI|nr:hypothetical protein FA13DRAFT_1738680 [Coprinellus micaceus]